MKKTLALMAIVFAVGGMTVGIDAEAKRLGSGKSAGMQKQNVAPPATPGAPANAGAPSQVAPAGAGAGAAAAAAAPKRSWMGPLAGLAAGLGIAALMSHFGMGGALGNIMMMLLVGVVVMVAIGFFMRKRAAAQADSLAGAGGVGPLGGMPNRQEPQMAAYRQLDTANAPQSTGGSLIGSRVGGGSGAGVDAAGTAAATPTGKIPAGFDTAGFERTARDQFMSLQAANDAKDLDRLRDYLTPQMFEVVRGEIAERGDATQATQVFGLNAQVLDVAEEPDQYVVSVRFTGSVREQPNATPEDLNEVWHLTKARNGFGGWMIAGIQQAT